MRFEPKGLVAYIRKTTTMYMQPCIRVRMRFEPGQVVAYIRKTTSMYMQQVVAYPGSNEKFLFKQG